MAENLNTSVYRNGDAIENVTGVNEWLYSDTVETGAWCYYNNNGNAFECPYGKLYNYHAISDARGVCPVGWHIPSDAEWQQLVAFIDPALNLSAYGELPESSIAGAALTSLWDQPYFSSTAANSKGFSNIGGGIRYGFPGQDFEGIGGVGSYWSNSENLNPSDGTVAYVNGRMISYIGVYRMPFGPFYGLSARCLRD
jgi:uncharacterized protein (TIGR02145 family)